MAKKMKWRNDAITLQSLTIKEINLKQDSAVWYGVTQLQTS